MTVCVKFRKLHPDAKKPEYKTKHASGMDLYALEDGRVYCGGWTVVRTGISIVLPTGFEGQIRPRSGLAAKHGITVLNTPGTIDADYRGEIKVILYNIISNEGYGLFGEDTFRFKAGDRIAQLVIAPVAFARLAEVELMPDEEQTERGDGGFGSTGR